ncbi:hypothetical protein WJX84_009294 [Apatococcus fuscideae]|uniref:Uncharacterized protein n=1 Tax=Apatococcus fuscideae TaxID=2026836 RepID=A0AAW1SWK4_9CHLO
MAKSARSNRKKDLHAQRRKALLQSEGYQKSQLARAAIQHSVTQAAEADQAVIEEMRQTEAAAMDTKEPRPVSVPRNAASTLSEGASNMDMDAAPRPTKSQRNAKYGKKKIKAGPKWSKKKPKRRSSHSASSLAWA